MDDRIDEHNSGIDEADESLTESEVNNGDSACTKCDRDGGNIREDLCGEEKTDGEKEEDTCEKEEDTSREGISPENNSSANGNVVGDEGEVRHAEYVWTSNGGYSDGTYHFKPENMREYVGSRGGYSSGYDSRSYTEGTEEKKRRRGGRRTLVWLIPIAVLLALALGMAGGFFVRELFFGDEPDFYDELEINMVKNEAPTEVEVSVTDTEGKTLTRTQVVELVSDAVVEVGTSTEVKNSMFGNYVVSGAGSGVVIAQNEKYAYIVTNYHVVEGASSISISCTDGSEFAAEYLDGDAGMDIAMLRIMTSKEFPKIVCGSSSNARVGEDVVAIGNPLGELGGTVTEGIVSALDRRVTIDGTTMVLMQTSAAVNPGNSGGGLFNMAGELVGIVNAKQSAEGIEGLGFAIPIDRIYDTLVEIIENKYIHGRPTLDIEVEYVDDIFEARVKYSLNATGIYVTNTANSNFKTRDYIYSINGERITDASGYAAAISALEVGDTVTVVIYRNGEEKTIVTEVVEYVPAGIFG